MKTRSAHFSKSQILPQLYVLTTSRGSLAYIDDGARGRRNMKGDVGLFFSTPRVAHLSLVGIPRDTIRNMSHPTRATN